MKILIAPDSFKGSLSAKQVGEIVKNAFQLEIPQIKINVLPMADGGEGTLEAILSVKRGSIIETTVKGSLEENIRACYGIMEGGKTAVIEVAKVIGITIVASDQGDPMLRTTFGIGEMILDGINKGVHDFIIGLGGSATVDGGLGMLQALGVKFLDHNKIPVKPIAASLDKIKEIDFSSLHPKIRDCNFKIASDVDNPLCGMNGASIVFGPQKGTTKEQAILLDQAMKNYAELIERNLKVNLLNQAGAGAAGGLGFALLAIGGNIYPGSQVISEAIGLEAKIKMADWVITGEGQSDGQTLCGKAPFYIGKLARENGVKAILISGGLGKGYEGLLDYFVSCHSIVNQPMSLNDAMKESESLLFSCSRNVARLLYKAQNTSEYN